MIWIGVASGIGERGLAFAPFRSGKGKPFTSLPETQAHLTTITEISISPPI